MAYFPIGGRIKKSSFSINQRKVLTMSHVSTIGAVPHVENMWEQLKQVNNDRLQEIETKGHADPLYYEHLNKINSALDQHKERADRMATVAKRPALEMREQKSY